MKEEIIKNAEHNTFNEGEVIDGYTDNLGQAWLKLNNYSDLESVSTIMHKDFIRAMAEQKNDIIEDIKNGITFGFYYRMPERLICFER